MHHPTLGVQLGSIVFVQLRTERINRDHDRTTIRLKVQNGTHHFRIGTSEIVTELAECFQVRAVQRVPGLIKKLSITNYTILWFSCY